MPHAVKVIPCQTRGCANEIVLPYSISLRTRQDPDTSAAGDPYLDVACPQCGHVFRSTPEMSRQRVYDTPDPYQPPAQTVWLKFWLKYDSKTCTSHVLVESAMVSGATDKEVQTFVSRWLIDDEVTCHSGHQANQPPEITWSGIVFPIWRTIHRYA
jgi:hypothetical protein